MAVSLLGPLQIDGADGLAPRDRVVLSALALHPGDVLSAEQLADALWGDRPPPSWAKVVQGCILRIRRDLGAPAVETTSAGYRLTLADDDLDVRRFERLLQRGRSLLTDGEPDRAAIALERALGLWRGRPFGDLEHWPPGSGEAQRLEELRRQAQEALLEAELLAGHDVVAEAAALAAAEPLREHRWVLLATALYRSGRQADALAAVRRARSILREDLGLDPGDELAGVERAILNHDPALTATVRPLRPMLRCPYQGLLTYDAEDAEWFFGRDGEVSRCVQVLAATSFLVVVGPSGSGKSSLVRAGVVPALARSRRAATVVTPASGVAGVVAAVAAAHRDGVLVVDQLEELFTSATSSEAVHGYLEHVADTADGGRDVIVVLRADHFGRISAAGRFARLVERGLHVVTPMTGAELRDVVVGPATRASLRLQDGLVDLLLRDAGSEPGALPLLSHALAETWARREGPVLTVDGYRATGGIAGAVAQSAERLYESLPQRQRAVLRTVLLRLVTPLSGGEPAAVRVSRDAFAEDADRRDVVDLLVRARLVTYDRTTVAVAHEALVRAWPRFRAWLDEDAEGVRTLRHLTLAADDWQARGRPDSELYRGTRLSAALAWRARDHPDLTALETAFLDASAGLETAEEQAAAERLRHQARQNRRLRIAATGMAVALVLAVVAGVSAVRQSRDARSAAADEQVDRLVAESTALRSTRRDLAALLAVEAYRLRPDAVTRSALWGLFPAAPGFVEYLPLQTDDDVPLTSGHLLDDGRTLLAMGIDGVARAVDLDTGRVRRFLPPGIAADSGVLAVSADGNTAAAVAWQGSATRGGLARLNVFDVASGTRKLPEVDVYLDVGGVAVSPDGRVVALSGDRRGRVLLVDTLAARDLPRVPPDTPAVGVREIPPLGSSDGSTQDVRRTAALAFRADGMLVVGSRTGTVRVVEPATGRVVTELRGAREGTSDTGVLPTADGDYLVTTGPAGVVSWDQHLGRPAWAASSTGDPCTAAAVLLVTRSVLCGRGSGRVESLDLATGVTTGASYDLQRGAVAALVPAADGRTLLQLNGSEPGIARWDLTGSGAVGRLLPLPGDVPSGFSPDGRALLLVGDPAERAVGSPADATVVDARTGRVTRSLRGHHIPIWGRNRNELAVWTSEGTGHLLDLRSGRLLITLEGGFGEPPAGGQPARGDHLVAWGRGGTDDNLVVWDLRSGRLAGRPLNRSGDTASLTRDGSLFVVANVGVGPVSMREVVTGREVASRSDLGNAAMAPDGTVAGSRSDGRLAFYDPRTLRPVGRAVSGALGNQLQMEFSADGRTLATRGADGLVRLVDVPSRTILGEPISLDDAGKPISLSPDGLQLAVPGRHGVLLWSLDVRDWLAGACRMAGRNLTGAEFAEHLPGHEYRRTCAVP